MKEREEDIMIALYLAGEGEIGFDEAHMKKCFKVMKLLKRVREELKKKEPEGPENCGSLRE